LEELVPEVEISLGNGLRKKIWQVNLKCSQKACLKNKKTYSTFQGKDADFDITEVGSSDAFQVCNKDTAQRVAKALWISKEKRLQI